MSSIQFETIYKLTVAPCVKRDGVVIKWIDSVIMIKLYIMAYTMFGGGEKKPLHSTVLGLYKLMR